VPNVQLGIEINYADGSNVGPEGSAEEGEVKEYSDGNSNSSSNSHQESSIS